MNRRQVLAWTGIAALAAGGIARPVAARQATPEAATTTFLDPGQVHEIAVSFDEATYDAMIETFSSTGDKEWIEATVTIDGSTYDRAGMRLKGNSSLGMLGGHRGGEKDAVPAGTPEAMPSDSDDGVDTDIVVEGPGNGATAKTPELLPWLVRLDKNVDGQNHQGITELVIRSNTSATSLNEAVALDLLDLAGLASQRAALTRFRANERGPALRLTIEHPTDAWMLAHFPQGGYLYKAEAGGDWTYRGDDPEAYEDVFDLEAGGTGDDAADMQPLFDFLSFLNESDDAAFTAELASRLDIDAFATYLAMMDLIENFDDISGPGNNAYLHVGPESPMFTVIPWDMNLAFGGGLRITPEDGGSPPDMEELPPGADVQPLPGGTPADGPVIQWVGPGDDGGMQPNILVKRWEANPDLTGKVDAARARLHAELFASGTASEVLQRWVDVLNGQATDMVDASTVATEAAAIEEILARKP